MARSAEPGAGVVVVANGEGRLQRRREVPCRDVRWDAAGKDWPVPERAGTGQEVGQGAAVMR